MRLRGFLHEPTTIRPWLSVRMPTFGLSDDDVARAGNYLRAIAPSNPDPSAAPPGVTPAAVSLINVFIEIQARRFAQAQTLS